MHATRVLRSSSNFLSGTPRLLLPPLTWWETASASLQGVWSHVTDQSSRDEYEQAVEAGVIRDDVLAAATHGSVLTYALFHNLQNPLFRQHQFDAQEFVQAVGPALENFHDTLGKVRNQLPNQLSQEREELDEKLKQTDEDLRKQENLTEALLGVNHWRKSAQDDKDAPAAVLSRMTTDVCLDAFYYTAKLDSLSRSVSTEYVEGSSKVNEVALLNARADILRPEDEEPREHEEFRVSEVDTDNDPVAAQLDVLYEITHTYKQPPGSMAALGHLVANEHKGSSEKDAGDKEEEVVSYTNLVVAVFEGFLHGGPTKQLRWKLAMLREAFEFPHQMTVTRQD